MRRCASAGAARLAGGRGSGRRFITDIQPVTLVGDHVQLETLTIEHLPGLTEAGLFPELWRWIPTPVTDAAGMREYVLTALDELRRGVSLPFALRDRASGQIIGCTRFSNISRPDRRLEIGWTWVTPAFQRTRANTEAKFLLLQHAFEVLGAVRVELKTDALNEKSRRAILRIGATEEGIFRKHRLTSTGRMRDTVYFSIIDDEWPAVRERLRGMLTAGP